MQVELLRQQLANYEKDKQSLQQTKARLLNAEKQVKNLEWENEVLQQRFLKVQTERDELYEKFEMSIYDVQQKTGERSGMIGQNFDRAC
jgi:predicted transcriptional regulator